MNIAAIYWYSWNYMLAVNWVKWFETLKIIKCIVHKGLVITFSTKYTLIDIHHSKTKGTEERSLNVRFDIIIKRIKLQTSKSKTNLIIYVYITDCSFNLDLKLKNKIEQSVL